MAVTNNKIQLKLFDFIFLKYHCHLTHLYQVSINSLYLLTKMKLQPDFNPYLNSSRKKIEDLSILETESLSFQGKLITFARKHKKLSAIVLHSIVVINLLLMVHCVHGRYFVHPRVAVFKNDVVNLLNTVSDIFLVAVNIFGLYCFTKSNFLLETFTFTDLNHMIFNVNTWKGSKLAKVSRVLFWILPVVPVIAGIYLLDTEIGWRIYQYFLPRDIWYLLMHSMICSSMDIFRTIKGRFKVINDQLERLSNSYQPFTVSGITRIVHSKTQFTDIQTITQYHNNLCNHLDKFNSFSKIFTVSSVVCISLNLLYNFTIIIQDIVGPYDNNTKVATLATQPILAITSVVSIIL